MVNAERPDVVEVTILPCACVDVEPYVYGVALVDVELRNLVRSEHVEKTGARILVFCLYDKVL